MPNESQNLDKNVPEQIAIDGPGASGKTTIAERLAEHLNYLYFDTGVMYRAVTLEALIEFGSVTEETLVSELADRIQIDVRPPSIEDGRENDVIVNGRDVTWEIRSPAVNDAVSLVSAYPLVRKAMTERQRMIAKDRKVVMVGRDIGTVVIPDADLKIYLDASVEERARRRYEEEKKRGQVVSYEEILYSLRQRDKKDESRNIAPLKPAEDAIIIDTDHLTVEEVFERVKSLLAQT